MILDKDSTGKYVDLLWDDLSEEAQKQLLELMGDNGNYDVVPFTRIYIELGDE